MLDRQSSFVSRTIQASDTAFVVRCAEVCRSWICFYGAMAFGVMGFGAYAMLMCA